MLNGVTSGTLAFLHWWGSELRGLFPAGDARLRFGKRLVLSVEPARMRLIREHGADQRTLADCDGEAASCLDAVLAEAQKDKDLAFGIRFHPQFVFARNLELPAQAEANFGRILDLDLERATPFTPQEVYSSHIVLDGGSSRGKRLVRHLIIKRTTLDPLLHELAAQRHTARFVECWDDAINAPLPADFLSAATPAPQRKFAALALAVLATALAAASVSIYSMRHQHALAELEARAGAARMEAASARAALETSQAMAHRLAVLDNLLQSRPRMAQVMEELTKLLPDDTWLTALRIEGNTVEYTGFARSAAGLVPVLEQSPLLADVLLTAPVVLDNEQERERFSMRLVLEGVQPVLADRSSNE